MGGGVGSSANPLLSDVKLWPWTGRHSCLRGLELADEMLITLEAEKSGGLGEPSGKMLKCSSVCTETSSLGGFRVTAVETRIDSGSFIVETNPDGRGSDVFLLSKSMISTSKLTCFRPSFGAREGLRMSKFKSSTHKTVLKKNRVYEIEVGSIKQ